MMAGAFAALPDLQLHSSLVPPGAKVLRGVNDYQAAGASWKFPVTDATVLNLTCEFTVPPKPPTWDGNTQVYLWCGVNWYDSGKQCLGVMQPVLTYGCSPNAMSGVGCDGDAGAHRTDPDYSKDPYWYFSSQYVMGWGPGQARGSPQVFRTEPGRKLYGEMSYNAATDAWQVIGRDETTGQTSTYVINHPKEDPSRSWKEIHADAGTEASVLIASEPHQVSNVATQMPALTNFLTTILRPAGALSWQGGPGPVKVVQKGGLVCSDDQSVTPSECRNFASSGGCARDATWCHLCAASCGAAGASCGCRQHNPPVWRPAEISMNLQWQTPALFGDHTQFV